MRIIRKLTISEISAVDIPAQQDARALIFKRHEGNNEMDMTNTDVGALALFALECKAAEIRDANPDLTEAQAFAKAYSDPANRAAVVAERRGNRPGGFASAERIDPTLAIAKRDSALDALNAKAAELRKVDPSLTEAGAFAKVYRNNSSLAAAERRAAREALYA